MSGVAVKAWDASAAQSRLQRRRRWGLALKGGIVVVLLSMVADHVRPRNRHGDDWSRFEAAQVAFVSVIDGESIAVRGAHGSITLVHPWGMASFNAQWDVKASQALTALLTGRSLTLHLEPTQTRDERDRLLAYVYTDGPQFISVQFVRDGLVLADRRLPYGFHGVVDEAETQARKKRAGLWATATWEMMPSWRQKKIRREVETPRPIQ